MYYFMPPMPSEKSNLLPSQKLRPEEKIKAEQEAKDNPDLNTPSQDDEWAIGEISRGGIQIAYRVDIREKLTTQS